MATAFVRQEGGSSTPSGATEAASLSAMPLQRVLRLYDQTFCLDGFLRRPSDLSIDFVHT